MKLNSKASAVVVLLLLATMAVASMYTVAPAAAQADTNWPMFRHDPAHLGVGGSTAPDKMYVKWMYVTGGPIFSSPAVVDGKVYIGSNDNNLYCFSGDTGAVVWKYTTGEDVQSSPAVVAGKVYFGSCDKNIYCLNTDGTLVWKYPTGGLVYSSPNVVDGKVYIASMDKKLYCLDAATGTMVWNKTFPEVFYTVSPTIVDGKLYIGNDDKRFYCLDAATGDHVWNFSATSSFGASSAAVVDGRVHVGSDNNDFYTLNATTGKMIWKYNSPSNILQDYVRTSPAVYNGKVYAGLAHQFTVLDAALGAQTGVTEIWTFHTGNIQYSSPAISSNNKLTFGNNDLNIYLFDAISGTRLQTYWTTATVESSPAIANGKIYIGNGQGNVYCFDQVSGTVATTLSIGTLLDKTSYEYGTQSFIEGWIKPATAWVNVDITYVKPDGTSMLKTILAKADGKYWDTENLDQVGTWTATAQFNGYDVYSASTSDTLTFEVTGTVPATPPAPSTITCMASVTSAGDFHVTGGINPAVSGTVTLTYWKPDASSLTRTVTSNSMGAFEDTFEPTAAGSWIVQASWAGNSANTGAKSTMATAYASAEAADGDEPFTIPAEYSYYLYAIIGIGVALLVLVVFLILKSRK